VRCLWSGLQAEDESNSDGRRRRRTGSKEQDAKEGDVDVVEVDSTRLDQTTWYFVRELLHSDVTMVVEKKMPKESDAAEVDNVWQ
jgi:hypothetical protein